MDTVKQDVDQVFKKIDFLHLRDVFKEIPFRERPSPRTSN